MEGKINGGTILIHKAVLDELTKLDDDLADWCKKHISSKTVTANDENTMRCLRDVLNHVATCGLYKHRALLEWSQPEIADAQLLATAKFYGYTIATLENSAGKRDPKNPAKNAKIPNVAADLGVESISLFQMMRELEFRL